MRLFSRTTVFFAVIFMIGTFSFLKNGRANPAALKKAIGHCFYPDLDFPNKDIWVNGHKLNEAQAYNVFWFSECVAPFLPGTNLEKATSAARASWWALREGNLESKGADVFSYSNCHLRGTDQNVSKYTNFECPSNLWQVGIAGGQVANYSDEEVETAIKQILAPLGLNVTEKDLLMWSANLSGFYLDDRNDPEYRVKRAGLFEISQSTGKLRKSWLLRNPLIGTLLVQDLEVRRECQIAKRSFCFSGDWPAAMDFSGGKTLKSKTERMKQSIHDLKRFYLRALGQRKAVEQLPDRSW